MDCIPYINDLQIEINMLKEFLSDCRNEKEYKNISNLINSKEKKIEMYKNNLSKLSINSIEYRIYLKILEGKNSLKAVAEVANENYLRGEKPTDVNYIWRKYYKKIKKIIKTQ